MGKAKEFTLICWMKMIMVVKECVYYSSHFANDTTGMIMALKILIIIYKNREGMIQ